MKMFFETLIGTVLALSVAGFAITSPAFAQDGENTLDKVPQGNYISCVEVRKGVSVCTLNAKSLPDFKVSVPSKTFARR